MTPEGSQLHFIMVPFPRQAFDGQRGLYDYYASFD